MPTASPANPRTPAQQAHRTGFGLVARLSSDLKEAHAIGLYKESLRRRTERRRHTTFDVFKHLNRACVTALGIDYPHLVISKGPLPRPDIAAASLAPDGTLTLALHPQPPHSAPDDRDATAAVELILVAYSPALRACCVTITATDSAHLTARIPASWQRFGDLHLYAFHRGKNLRTSDSVYLPLTLSASAPTVGHTDPINTLSDPINPPRDPINPPAPDPTTPLADTTTLRLDPALRRDPTLPYAGYARLLGISEATVKRRLQRLKAQGLILRQGSNKTGRWLLP